jgi:hypothetical protein
MVFLSLLTGDLVDRHEGVGSGVADQKQKHRSDVDEDVADVPELTLAATRPHTW